MLLFPIIVRFTSFLNALLLTYGNKFSISVEAVVEGLIESQLNLFKMSILQDTPLI